MEKRKIPPQNYLILILIFIAVVIGLLYFFELNQAREDELVSKSFLISSSTTNLIINTLDELESTLNEVPYDFFIFTGYTGSIEEYEIELELKPVIDDYNLYDKFYYLNITDLIEDENFLNDLSNILDTNITSVPTIIYVSNDKVANKVTAGDDLLKVSDFIKLLEIYEFEKSE